MGLGSLGSRDPEHVMISELAWLSNIVTVRRVVYQR